MKKTINLTEEVMVSDPCYSVPTWCQHKLTGVLPGEYLTTAFRTKNTGGWGERCAALIAVHKDFTEDALSWRAVKSAVIGVDSGQCGIFSMGTYRNDAVFMEKSSFGFVDRNTEGDHWYGHMCDRTLHDDQWGSYDGGVVSSSGIGDGSYKLLVAKHKGKIVGIAIDFYILKLLSRDFNDILEIEEYV
jgi:hypothetical protein